MGTPEGSRAILQALKEGGVDFVASVPDINVKELIELLYRDEAIAHVPVGREEEGIGVCTGAYLAGKRPAILMQNAGLMNSCNALTTTAIQFGIPILLLVYYAGDIGDDSFHMLGLLTEPVLSGLGLKHTVMRDPARVRADIAAAIRSAQASKRPVALVLSRAVL
jgi:sulfopyruvate decarboxylase subunit alpha